MLGERKLARVFIDLVRTLVVDAERRPERGRRRQDGGAESGAFDEQRVAARGTGVVSRGAVWDLRRRCEPRVAEACELDAAVAPVGADRGDERRAGDVVRGVEHQLAGGGRHGDEELRVAVEEVEETLL